MPSGWDLKHSCEAERYVAPKRRPTLAVGQWQVGLEAGQSIISRGDAPGMLVYLNGNTLARRGKRVKVDAHHKLTVDIMVERRRTFDETGVSQSSLAVWLPES